MNEDNIDLGESTAKLTSAVENLPQILERKRKIDSHTNIATSLLGEIKNTTSVSHGIAISSDSKYAFISVEGIGGEPGIVDVINLETYELVSSVEVGKQAGGIAFWKKDI